MTAINPAVTIAVPGVVHPGGVLGPPSTGGSASHVEEFGSRNSSAATSLADITGPPITTRSAGLTAASVTVSAGASTSGESSAEPGASSPAASGGTYSHAGTGAAAGMDGRVGSGVEGGAGGRVRGDVGSDTEFGVEGGVVRDVEVGGRGPLDSDRAGALAGAFKALGDPVRLRLLSMIVSATDGEICVCDLSESFALSGPTISHHLRILREAGLIRGARRGTWVYYRAVSGELTRLAGILGAGCQSPAIA